MNFKRLKKGVAVALGTVMMTAALTGCGGEQKEPVTVLDQPVQNFSFRFGHMRSSRRIFWHQYSTDDLRTQ